MNNNKKYKALQIGVNIGMDFADMYFTNIHSDFENFDYYTTSEKHTIEVGHTSRIKLDEESFNMLKDCNKIYLYYWGDVHVGYQNLVGFFLNALRRQIYNEIDVETKVVFSRAKQPVNLSQVLNRESLFKLVKTKGIDLDNVTIERFDK